MFKSLIEGFAGRKPREEEGAAPVAAATEPPRMAVRAPETDAGPIELPPTLGFVAHQPVLDRQQRAVAYLFAARDERGAAGTPARRREFDALLLSTLAKMGVYRLLDYRRAFIQISLDSLDLPELATLPARSVLLLVEPGCEPLDDGDLARLEALKAGGLRLALAPARFDDSVVTAARRERLFALADVMVLDFAASANRVLAPLLDQLPRRYPKARWFARNVGTAEDMELCLHGPAAQRFALFHGVYLAGGRSMPTGKVDSGQARVLEIMRLLRCNAEAHEIEAQFKLDSLLLFKLLRFVNAPVNGLSRKVMSIEESLLLLGRERLFKWMSLLLFTARRDDVSSPGLLEKSLIRAAFMERLGDYRGSRLEAEHLFLTGMFSLLAALLNVPLADALEPLDLPAPVADALLAQKGLFAPYFQLAVACEQNDPARVTRLVALLKLDLDLVNRFYTEAVLWTQQVLREEEPVPAE
ncbi:EAL and modified HD-GYP domain-containing signal transduction protein [Crenobacter luteus]|uniref:EAL and HDOD domain-containing protein n=1 Tax=Crenobacter luteus TaxID=1452487 RepID=UPI0010502DA0|nr:HDOD domain-containing protein [Crenobacter luteus]TCP15711.1 EAL and modified HD-GYP domain-containing signal transduction protein [Crenobacter luteus]